MDNINSLLNDKEEALKNILSISKNILFTDDNTSDSNTISNIYLSRKNIFDKLKQIDSTIIQYNPSHQLTNTKITALKNEIIAQDVFIKARADEITQSSKIELRKLRKSKKITNMYNVPYSTSQSYYLNNKG